MGPAIVQQTVPGPGGFAQASGAVPFGFGVPGIVAFVESALIGETARRGAMIASSCWSTAPKTPPETKAGTTMSNRLGKVLMIATVRDDLCSFGARFVEIKGIFYFLAPWTAGLVARRARPR
jgi:hypothetical protein